MWIFVKRKTFVGATGAIAAGALAGLLPRSAAVAAQPPDSASEFRVRLFGAGGVGALEISGINLRAGDGSVTRAAQSVLLRDTAARSFVDGRPWGASEGMLTLRADSPLRVTDSARSIDRQYAGVLQARWTHDGLVLVNRVPVEEYVASVLASEASSSWPFEALRAQAIAVRTFALVARDERSSRDWDLGDDTSSQVYRGRAVLSDIFVRSSDATRAQFIAVREAAAQVFYSAVCGGHTASLSELNGQSFPPHLEGIADVDAAGNAYCAAAPYYRWRNSLSKESLARVAGVVPESLDGFGVSARWPSGRVKTVRLVRHDGAAMDMSGRQFYARALQALGYKVLPSTLFDVQPDGAGFAFTGRGMGHGVGLCQWGARGRADAGQRAEEILQAFFPGTQIRSRSA